ncbi:hypothetical protein [Aquimarina longa]|uniref:hypothetical protein n=1 Tax=Aquimarina longa TaxID=1080221 RepID=UPI000783A78F|nr:hypothetical protein [Aquimarina longa]
MADPKDIGKAFREKLKELDRFPSTLTWDDIESELPKKERKLFLYWIRTLSVILLILLLIFKSDNYKHRNVFGEMSNTIEIPDYCKTSNTYQKYSIGLDKKIDGVKTTSNIDKDNFFINYIRDTHYLLNNYNNTDSLDHKKRTSRNIEVKKAIHKNKENQLASTNKNNIEQLKGEVKHTSKKTKAYKALLSNSNDLKNVNKDSIKLQDKKVVEVIPKKKDTLIYMERIQANPFNMFSFRLHMTSAYPILPVGSLISDQIPHRCNVGIVTLNYGILLKSNISKKIELRMGYGRLKLTNELKGIAISELPSSLRGLEGGVSGGAFAEESKKVDVLQKLIHHEVSLGVQYKITNKLITTSLVGGLSAMVLNRNKIIIKTDSGTLKRDNTNLFRINYNIQLGSSFEYKLSEKLFFSVEPLINYSLKKRVSSKSFYPMYLTVHTGFFYKI